MNNFVEVVYGNNGETSLALRKSMPVYVSDKKQKIAEKDDSRVIVIDMFEESKVCYEC